MFPGDVRRDDQTSQTELRASALELLSFVILFRAWSCGEVKALSYEPRFWSQNFAKLELFR